MVRGLVKVIRLSRINYPFALDQQKATVVATRTAKYPQVYTVYDFRCNYGTNFR